MNTTKDLLANRHPYPRNQKGSKILGSKNPRKTQAETNRLATYLAEKFNSPEYMPFFYRAAWALNEAAIHLLAERAVAAAPANARAYFITSVKSHPSYVKRYVIDRRHASEVV